MHSENGWLAITDPSKLHHWHIPGVKETIALRPGAAGLILVHFASWYNDKIRRIDGLPMDDWGWAPPKVIPGTTVISNHGSGTAIDINATHYPSGTRHYTSEQIAEIHKRLALPEYKESIRWGGDYQHSTVDQMHFEINVPWTTASLVAHHLKTTPRGIAILHENPGMHV